MTPVHTGPSINTTFEFILHFVGCNTVAMSPNQIIIIINKTNPDDKLKIRQLFDGHGGTARQATIVCARLHPSEKASHQFNGR